ncbi:hypothetical protein [Neptunomonas phycophila]|uniref:hypothetical protein n=1 Tax=Neptunomonas phycophila TaxID=1572645 RepID=UPI000948BDC7|nr:hypothetical protein [Neptunomonas phycophila]
MLKRFFVSGILYLFFYAGGVKAMDLDFGFDYKVDNVFLDLYVNNVPFIDPGYDLGTSGSMQSNLDFKYMLYNGRNNLTFITHKVDKKSSAELKVLFKSWDVNNFTMPFESVNNGYILTFDFEKADRCELEGLGGNITIVENGCDIKEKPEGYVISVDFDINYPELYRSKYLDEAVLVKNTDNLKDKLAIEYKKVYQMFKERNVSDFKKYYSPSFVKYNKDTGGAIDDIFNSVFGKVMTNADFKLSDFELDDSRVYVTEDRKLFTLAPSPFSMKNSETSESFEPIMHFWFDKNGQVKIKQ